ncbi:hypothetical protein D3C76_1654650 [compost metagenome]
MMALVKINSGMAMAWKKPDGLLCPRCRPVVANAETPNEKLQNDALNGCDRYQGIRRRVNSSCSRP